MSGSEWTVRWQLVLKEKLRQRGVVVDALPVGVEDADADATQRRIDSFFTRNS